MNLIDQKAQLLKKGYIHIKNFFQNEQLNKILKISHEILDKAKTGKWDYIRVYREYPIFFGKINLFGVDYPLHETLNPNTFDAMQDLDYKKYLLDILGWKNFKTTLIRLHANSSFYNYQGEWHRDDPSYPSPNSFQTIIYLLDEEGYRIVPKDKNHLLVNYGMSTNKQRDSERGFAQLPKEMYDIIQVKKGDILVHESCLLHQGFCKKKRLHYHLRHIRNDNINNLNTKDKFNFSENFLKNFNLNDAQKHTTFNYFENNFSIRFKRFKVFILYFFPRFRSIVNNLFNKKKQSVFHSTIWQ